MTEEVGDTYRALADASPDPTFFVNLETGLITDVNDRTTDLLGYERSDLVGSPVTEVHPSEDTEQYRALFEASTGEETFRFEELPDGTRAKLVTESGETVPASVHARRVTLDGVPHMFSIVRDQSDQIAARDRLERQREELAVLNRLIRHDIRNDMAVILGWADRLPEADDPSERAEIVDRIRTHGDHVVSLTDLAREYVDVITGETDPDLEPVTLGPLLRDEAASARQTYPEADVAVYPDATTDVSVAASPLLESVFRNLVVNAVQHNDAGTPCVRLDVTVADDTVTVRVVDDGPGIPDDRKTELFGKGEMGIDSDGSGIGLYLVDRLVTQFGGRVYVEDRDPEAFPLPGDGGDSAEGVSSDHPGSVFVVELDRVDAGNGANLGDD